MQLQAINKRVIRKYMLIITLGASPVAQWLRIRLTIQGTQVRSLAGELDPTCLEAAKPTLRN